MGLRLITSKNCKVWFRLINTLHKLNVITGGVYSSSPSKTKSGMQIVEWVPNK